MLVQLQDIHLAYPDKPVLTGVSLAVHRGARIALVGENGAGKTSLLRTILGRLLPDRGRVTRATGIRIGYLAQTMLEDLRPDQTVIEAALEPFAGLMALGREIEDLQRRLGHQESGHAARAQMTSVVESLGEAQARFEAGGGYTYHAQVEATLHGLGLSAADWRRAVGELSSGEQVRLALARVLRGDYDLLLLDEPTNHLDLPARLWLEEQLQAMSAAYIVASHDRRFLDALATSVAHLERGVITVYQGGYSAFRAQQAQVLETAWRTYEKRERAARRLERQMRNYRTWATARERDKRGRVDKGYIGHKAAKLMKRAITARRRLEATVERMRVEKPRVPDPVAIDFPPVRGGPDPTGETWSAGGRPLLWAEEVVAGIGRRALTRPISFVLSTGERSAILGPNGCGKTTLLRTLLGELEPMEGSIRRSPATRPGYFDQEAGRLPDGSALETLLEIRRDETLARMIMGRMHIRRESVLKPVASMSAGERAKVLLARLLLGDHTLLVLDEPTNYLDIETQDALLGALEDFAGAIIFVSHDRHFIETLATDVIDLAPRTGPDGGAGRARCERI